MKHLIAQPAPWSNRIEFLLTEIKAGSQMRAVAVAVEMETLDEGVIPSPTFTLDPDEAQALIDQLWNCGLRPTEGTGSAGALAATQNHLADMRRLVFHAMDKG